MLKRREWYLVCVLAFTTWVFLFIGLPLLLRAVGVDCPIPIFGVEEEREFFRP